MNSKPRLHFVLGDRLPTIYDAAIQIFQVCPSFNRSSKSKETIGAYADALINMWQKSFGSGFTLSRTAVFTRLENIMNDYVKKVQGRERYGDAKRGIPAKLMRHINREWRMAPAFVTTKGRPRKRGLSSRGELINNDLLDISKNANELTGDELAFYEDQKGSRMTRLSEQIDLEYEEEMAVSNDIGEANEREAADIEDFVNPVEFLEVMNTPLRSERKRRAEPQSEGSQDDRTEKSPCVTPTITPKPRVRRIRNVDEKFKDAVATVSYRTALSVAKARVAVQTTCEKIYGHKYYLSVEEKEKFEPSDQEGQGTVELRCKKPRSKGDYERNYQFVLPSAKVVSNYKNEKALHQEIAAAKALASIQPDTRCTLHFDTTGRSRVDGEWPALILNFLSDDKMKCQMFRLRALFFAYEDRAQIVKLVVETLKRLAIASDDESITSATLWKNVYSMMTDAVRKNLSIETGIAKQLGSSHVPLHILCKSHTCEKLDEACTNSLVRVEAELKYSELLIKRQPRLKSFIRQSKCVAICAMKALLKLVSNEESAKPTSLSKEFDIQLEKDGVCKSLSLYKERRFTKLGYTAGAIYECIPQFKEILEQTCNTNMLTEACKLYLESEYVTAALKALANFTYKVTMPYLNCVERSDQNDLVKILKKLYEDLKIGKMDTLKDFHVPWTHIDMLKLAPTSSFDHYLLKTMSENAAEGILMQCGGEYWLEGDEAPRATQLHKLTSEQRKNIPTENLESERYLAKFGYLASISASKSNKFFKAKRIRDDLMFNGQMTNEEDVSKSTRRITKVLNEMEINWTEDQRQIWRNKVEESMKKKARTLEYKDILLRNCKSHGGPFTNLQELKIFVNVTADEKKLKKDLRQEIGFQKMLHPVDVRERSHLYRMNFLSIKEIVENLSILLDNDAESYEGEVVSLPSEEDIMDILTEKESVVVPPTTTNSPMFTYLQPLAVIWDDNNGKRYWSIGFFLNEVDDATICVDHLERKGNGSQNVDWVRPDSDDIQEVVTDFQVIPSDVEGDWVDLQSRQLRYHVKNAQNIQKAFQNYI